MGCGLDPKTCKRVDFGLCKDFGTELADSEACFVDGDAVGSCVEVCTQFNVPGAGGAAGIV